MKSKKCVRCGKIITQGYVNEVDKIYICDKCFKKYMNETYGKHMWMYVNDDGYGGNYLVSDDTMITGYSSPGIYRAERF